MMAFHLRSLSSISVGISGYFWKFTAVALKNDTWMLICTEMALRFPVLFADDAQMSSGSCGYCSDAQWLTGIHPTLKQAPCVESALTTPQFPLARANVILILSR